MGVHVADIAVRLDRALITRRATAWLAVCVALMIVALACLDVVGKLNLVSASSVFAATLMLSSSNPAVSSTAWRLAPAKNQMGDLDPSASGAGRTSFLRVR